MWWRSRHVPPAMVQPSACWLGAPARAATPWSSPNCPQCAGRGLTAMSAIVSTFRQCTGQSRGRKGPQCAQLSEPCYGTPVDTWSRLAWGCHTRPRLAEVHCLQGMTEPMPQASFEHHCVHWRGQRGCAQRCSQMMQQLCTRLRVASAAGLRWLPAPLAARRLSPDLLQQLTALLAAAVLSKSCV